MSSIRAAVSVICLLVLSPIGMLAAQDMPLDIAFGDEIFTFDEYPGITVRLSEPFLRYQKWDTARTGQSWFSVALELRNQTDHYITAISFSVVAFDSAGGVLSRGRVSTGPMTFEPLQESVLEPGYVGVYDAFFSKSPEFNGLLDRLEIDIVEVKTASAPESSGPAFSSEWFEFDEFPGLRFQVSEPFRYIDDLSGNERFALALKFKNDTGGPVRFLNFFVRIFDDIGPLYEQEVQGHNQRFEPGPVSFFADDFPADYEGIDRSFYTYDVSLFDVFKKVEVILLSVE